MGFLDKWVESLDYEYEILSSCTRYKSPRSTCQRCLDVCEHDAITIVNNRPFINKDKCVECGNCIGACPVQAVAGIFPKRMVIQDKLLVTGEHLPTVKEMLMLYKKGIREIIGEDSSLTVPWLEVIKEVNLMLHQLGEDSFKVTYKAIEKAEEVYSRRELFSHWKKESKFLLKQVAPAKWRFNHKDLDVTKYYPDYQFTKMSLNPDKCTICKACELLCEKKCLNITDSSFSVSAQACLSCRLCVEICPEKAISLEDKISKVQEIHYPIYKRKCSICNQEYDSFYDDGEKCTTCTNGFLSPYIS